MREYRIGTLKGRFVVSWQDGGTRRRFRLNADSLRDAEREARDLILRKTATQGGMTVESIWRAYQAEKKGRRMERHMEQTGRIVLPHFGALRPEQITVADCRAYTEARRATGKRDYTIHTELGHLRTCLLWAQKSRLIDRAPQIERPQTPPPRDRYLSRGEVDKLLAVETAPHIRLAILLMLTTAARVGAVLELTWDRVDLERGIIKLAPHDIGPRKGRATVPINNTLRAALEQARQCALSPYVIEWGGKQVGSIKTGFNAAVKAAQIEHCTAHDLRRTAGRLMVESGVPIEEVAQYLGHSNPSVTRSTYAQFSPDYLRRAAGSLEFGGPRAVQQTKEQTLKHR